ncbi:putative transcriptional regulator [Gordonia araii NBRC 100433]|uniref:Putative transcriptional regulator n=1 Tax=Gordonia araii NBRC 100433 TaxID=1073574 RepID=G7GXG8_9ACTN|nr:putative transcriptional regulator [Gordonia araii NBRC 100433]
MLMVGRIFISYSTRDRDIADLVCSYLESEGKTVWIAPRDVPPGLSYPEAIIGALRDSEVGLLVLSSHSNLSPHVLREVERISADGKRLYVLRTEDVKLSDGLSYFASMVQWIEAPRDRLLRDPASVLRPIIAAPTVSTEPATVARAAAVPTQSSEVSFSVLAEQQRRMLTTFGVAVLDYICQQPNPAKPIPQRELLSRLLEVSPGVFDGLTQRQFDSLLKDAIHTGCVPGLNESDEGLFVIEENIAVKRERNQVAKGLIARHAAKLVGSGMVVAVDGGSTTLPLIEDLLARVEAGDLEDVQIVTNSLTSAQAVSGFMSKSGWSDESALVRLYLVGGIVRPNTHATTWGGNVARESAELLDELGTGAKPIDIGFVGGNGFELDSGITMGSDSELGFKRFVLENSQAPYVVADSSKAGITLSVKICDWDEGFTLITNVLPPAALESLDELVLAGTIVEVRE